MALTPLPKKRTESNFTATPFVSWSTVLFNANASVPFMNM